MKADSSTRIKIFSFIILCFCFINPVSAQVFTKVEGIISSAISDSRSVNVIDVNNDGWEEVFISNGLGSGQADFLYINNGDGIFNQIDDSPISQLLSPSVGASFADVNNDGHIDGVITSWYEKEDLFYLNNGEGDFELQSDAGLNPATYGETASFGDYDNDGLIDLYITNSGGDGKNFLYRNIGDGKFQMQADHPLMSDEKPSRSAIWADVDGNGELDLFITNEGNKTNDLYINKGNGAFEKYLNGSLATSQSSSMTASWGDIDNDGDLDVFIGNAGFYEEQRNQLFLNEDGTFIEVIDDPVTLFKGCTYGSSMVDYNNDGHLDLFITNGFCKSNLGNRLYRNKGDGTFEDRSSEFSVNPDVCSYGNAWGDFNNDGFMDLVIANCKNSDGEEEQVNLYMLNNGNENSWLKLKLEGVVSNRSAIGARIYVKSKINGTEVHQMREITSQSGYSGQNSLMAHFGLGDARNVESIRIEWPSGKSQEYNNIELNQLLVINEDGGK
ncbi:MAG: CRTAC1 family protein [Saprospiraceae bacterium]|nr:CRTAC1 family protein [Saprospiraceae bacterium]